MATLLLLHLGSRFSPNQYWVPLTVVTRQYSPRLSPLPAPVRSSMRAVVDLLEDPDVVIQGNRVLHLRYRVRR